ncbi:MAG: sigma-70 family RNA polymerase sigma factor [Bacteroidota bacterium]
MSDYQHIHRDLILLAQKGEPSAQERLYKLYAQAMYNVCRRIVGDDEEARDLLQESFVDAFQKLPTLREVNTFSSWIKRIVTNNCINAVRRRRLVMTELKESYDRIDDDDGDFDYSKHRAEQVMGAVEKLPDGCRTVLSLYLFEGYDHKEIGEILGISESASKAQYCKAKAKIRNQLGNKMQHYV